MSTNTAEATPSEVIFKSQELTIEQMKALYFDKDALITQPEPVYGFTSPQSKFYYTFNRATMRPEYFMPVTGFLQKCMPTPPPIIDKMVDMGRHAFASYMNERAAYGTMMDKEFNKFLIAGTYDMQALPDIIREHHREAGSLIPVEYWIEEFNTDITALAQWIFDYDVKPLAIGLMLVSRQLGIGGKIDLVCMMNDMLYTDKTPKADRKRVRRLVDFKSGKNGFYESHILQCEAYRECWDENLPDYPLDGISNFAPKKWQKEPNYDFKDHTKNEVTHKLPHYIELARIDGMAPKSDIKMFKGTLTIGQPITADQYQVVPVSQLIVDKMLARL